MNKQNKMMEKQTYVAPSIETIEVENEGVMAFSNGASTTGIGHGGGIGLKSGRGRANTTSVNDLEDLINDILTFEK